MNAIFDKATFRVEIVHVFGGGESPWVCMEAVVSAKTIEGEWDFAISFPSTFLFCKGNIPHTHPYFTTTPCLARDIEIEDKNHIDSYPGVLQERTTGTSSSG